MFFCLFRQNMRFCDLFILLWLYNRLFLCGFPVGASDRNLRYLEFLGWFCWVFRKKWLEFWDFLKKLLSFCKNPWVWDKISAKFLVLEQNWLSYTNKLCFSAASKQKRKIFLSFSDFEPWVLKKMAWKPPGAWVFGLKKRWVFSELEFFSPWVFRKRTKKKPDLEANISKRLTNVGFFFLVILWQSVVRVWTYKAKM